MRTPFAFNAFALKHPNHPRGQGDRLPPTVTDVSRLGGAGASSTQEAADPGERRSAAGRAWARARWPSGFPVALTLADPEFRKA